MRFIGDFALVRLVVCASISLNFSAFSGISILQLLWDLGTENSLDASKVCAPQYSALSILGASLSEAAWS